MGEPLIKNLEEIIGQRLSRNETIKKTEILNFLEPGENYLSEMTKINVSVKNRITEAERDIYIIGKCVAKPPPNGNDFVKDFSPFLFTKEMMFYKEVIPAIQTFLKNRGASPVDYYPEFYGGRLNLSGGSKADSDAVLLLENLHTSGYQNMDRHEGFDFDGAKTVLKDLAHFHAVPVAMKLLEPKLFQEKIQKIFDIKPPSPPKKPEGKPDEPPPPMPALTKELMVAVLEEDDKCVPAIPSFLEMIEKQRSISFEEMLNMKQREPFATMAHMDMWLNNTMQKLDHKNRPIKNKFVDFQVLSYASPVRDLLFLLITSVQLSVLKTRFDYLLKYYHDNFTKVLKELGCDLTPFSYENFIEEVKAMAPASIEHGSFFLLIIVSGKKGVAADPTQAAKLVKDDLDQKAREKFRFIIHEAYKRGWMHQS
ncbi:unnamed protein product [Phaedon cochleariae]|uniref:CHK kinase-like domain-containing protein n=1 Tax=Phaedon cochleariae TaxID=80249 RepID=A0A9P0DQG6_PHACE|nr:unnamed protein product [Phaedon cochleariae]